MEPHLDGPRRPRRSPSGRPFRCRRGCNERGNGDCRDKAATADLDACQVAITHQFIDRVARDAAKDLPGLLDRIQLAVPHGSTLRLAFLGSNRTDMAGDNYRRGPGQAPAAFPAVCAGKGKDRLVSAALRMPREPRTISRQPHSHDIPIAGPAPQSVMRHRSQCFERTSAHSGTVGRCRSMACRTRSGIASGLESRHTSPNRATVSLTVSSVSFMGSRALVAKR